MSWFVISLHYVQPLSAIDGAMRSHVGFLEKHRKAGVFIAWGRKVPRDGGIILARGESRGEIERIMAEDPFVARHLADVEVTEFLPNPPPSSSSSTTCSIQSDAHTRITLTRNGFPRNPCKSFDLPVERSRAHHTGSKRGSRAPRPAPTWRADNAWRARPRRRDSAPAPSCSRRSCPWSRRTARP